MSRHRLARLALALVVLMTLVGCGGDTTASGGDGKLKVVATTTMIADLVQVIGGERVSVTGLMGPGIDPHLFKASERDVTTLSEANIIFYNGLHLEAKLAEVFERMQGRVKTVAVTDSIDKAALLAPPEFAGAYDPHVWFDVTFWKKATEQVRDALVAADAEGAQLFRDNATRYLAQLDELHAYVQTQAQKVPAEQRVLITAHDAFNYFGRAYGFDVRGLQGISTASEAGTADVQALADFIAERRIAAIFVESSVPPRNIEAVQAAVRERGFEVKIGGQLFSDALGDAGTPAGTYIGMVRANIDTIVGALAPG